MSHRFVPVGWTRSKILYDAALLGGVAAYLVAYVRLAPLLGATPLDDQSLRMRAFGSGAFLLLTLALAIGPLARLDPRFLPLLYNRRHLGVVTCLLALAHAAEVLGWHFAFSPTPGAVALLTTEPGALPFIAFGLLALCVLILLAATSHDFWLAFLGPGLWKGLHQLIYLAYAAVVAHLAFGRLQDPGALPLALLLGLAVCALLALHLIAASREARVDADIAPPAPVAPWLIAGRAAAIPEGRALVVRPPGGEKVAIFRHEGRLSAVSHLCAHQHGPLGEGQVLDGCITCPWHGYQYRLEDGRSPPPFTERIATYRLRLVGGWIWLDPRANPPGTHVPALVLP
ncbi:ferric reductase-like transmembrane domain-containing protein [Roseococcus sp. SDR]|uniref:Rieske 2Fe-2S domain-containing protein n=1 Tax=Roseococcus sp. SDR TaxID=2835532 RepID=UPI001BCDD87D|nr:Rieske 2Fe-2S domain-containing protein [Roseococcus sp. SDR]MBS7791637.1 ferric reductase-like transmembrane domain-containing protein [Roseococcus sp. SDR]MBV1846951.1 ferric reductase-like transmembrane domain-containing protein [Roseococcus sp. SDR]